MDFVAKRNWFYLLSLLVIIPGILSMAIPPSFRVGIEFTGGSALTVTFERPVEQAALRIEMAALGHPEAVIQRLGENTFLIRTKTLAEAQRDTQGGVKATERAAIENALKGKFGPLTSELFSVSPLVARETVRNAVVAVLIASVAILLYITWAFRRVPNPFRMGAATIIAAIHDVLVTLGLFSILGKFLNVEVNAMFITGVLTVIGYSVHDTIVVFDRIRENSLKGVIKDLQSVINVSIMETMGRSLNTSLTTLIVIIALLLLGGSTIQSFMLTLLIGIITGTYSSICMASQLLVSWEKREWLGPWSRRGPTTEEAAAAKAHS